MRGKSIIEVVMVQMKTHDKVKLQQRNCDVARERGIVIKKKLLWSFSVIIFSCTGTNSAAALLTTLYRNKLVGKKDG